MVTISYLLTWAGIKRIESYVRVDAGELENSVDAVLRYIEQRKADGWKFVWINIE